MTTKYRAFLLGAFLFTGCSYTDPRDKRNGAEDALLEKTRRIGMYLASADKAEKEGYVQTAVYLGEVAEEEIRHAAELAAHLSRAKDTKSNLKELYKLERLAGTDRYARLAKELKRQGKMDLALLFERLALDEKRHSAGLKGLLKDIR